MRVPLPALLSYKHSAIFILYVASARKLAAEIYMIVRLHVESNDFQVYMFQHHGPTGWPKIVVTNELSISYIKSY